MAQILGTQNIAANIEGRLPGQPEYFTSFRVPFCRNPLISKNRDKSSAHLAEFLRKLIKNPGYRWYIAKIMGTSQQVCGTCAILGQPNVGKSTLLNRILGVHLAAVSNKPQTTRSRILGVRNLEHQFAQIIFMDTPGRQTGSSPLRKFMRKQTQAAATECDVALEMVDAASLLREGIPRMAPKDVTTTTGPCILAINKIDKIPRKHSMLPLLEAFAGYKQYQEIIPISAKTGNGIDLLEQAIAKRLPSGPPVFPEDMYTDCSQRRIASELIREQVFRQLGQEIPYGTTVEVESFQERSSGDVVIHAAIHVEKLSHKAIVIGRGGVRIRSLGERARSVLGKLLGCPVHVRLFVKVSEQWTKTSATIQALGYGG